MSINVPSIMKQVAASFTSFVLVLSMVSGAMPFFVSQVASASSPYSQDFSTNTADWTDVTLDAGTGVAAPGAFTKWGGYRNSFPSGGYSTQLDVYLPATDGTDKQFDFSSAINNQAGTHLRDFIFNVGTKSTTPNQWFVNVSNGAPGDPFASGNVAINTTAGAGGWYTLKQDFKNSFGILEVTMTVAQQGGGQVKSWVLSNPADVIATAVGGNRYGWFVPVGTTVPSVKIDNAQLILGSDPVATTYGFDVNQSGNFTQYQPNQFTVTTHTSDPSNDGSPMVRAYFTDNGGNGYYEYYDGTTFQHFNGTTGFGPAGGFEYREGATSTLRARYAQTGTYTSHVEFRQVGTNTVIAAKDVTFTVVASAAASTYSNGFETDTNSWSNTDGITSVDRVLNGTAGVQSATGSYHAQATESDYTNWGGYSSQFPSGGYVTEQDVYLDMTQATGMSDKRVDFSSAINDTAGNHRRDFVITLGTNPNVANEWLVNAGNGTPGNPSASGNAAITKTGWYTIQHSFRDNGSGVLTATIKLIRVSDGAEVFVSQPLSNPSDVIGVTVGGNRYGWFVTNDFANLPIDNTRKGPNPVKTEPRSATAASAGNVQTLAPISATTTARVFSVNYGTPTTDSFEVNKGKVLGTSTKKNATKASVAAIDTSEEGWKVAGLAWYWWVVIIAAVAALGWAGYNWLNGRRSN